MGSTKKAAIAADAKSLNDLPNVGEKTAADLRLLGFDEPAKLKGQDPYRIWTAAVAGIGGTLPKSAKLTFIA